MTPTDSHATFKEYEREGDSVPTIGSEQNGDAKRGLMVLFGGPPGAGKSVIRRYLSGRAADCTYEDYINQGNSGLIDIWFKRDATNKSCPHLEGTPVIIERVYFETETRRYEIVEAPSTYDYVPYVCSRAVQADIGVLVIPVVKDDHASNKEKFRGMLESIIFMKCVGITKLIVLINQMDRATVGWSEQCFTDTKLQVISQLKTGRYIVEDDIQFLPASGLNGLNINRSLDKEICSWWDGPCLLEALNNVEVPEQDSLRKKLECEGATVSPEGFYSLSGLKLEREDNQEGSQQKKKKRKNNYEKKKCRRSEKLAERLLMADLRLDKNQADGVVWFERSKILNDFNVYSASLDAACYAADHGCPMSLRLLLLLGDGSRAQGDYLSAIINYQTVETHATRAGLSDLAKYCQGLIAELPYSLEDFRDRHVWGGIDKCRSSPPRRTS